MWDIEKREKREDGRLAICGLGCGTAHLNPPIIRALCTKRK
jgi:hypothetical protein